MKQAFNPVLPGWEYGRHDSSGSVTIPAGKQALYFTYCGSGNLDWRSLTLE